MLGMSPGTLHPNPYPLVQKMNVIEKATIIHYHRHRIDTYHNGTVKALGWRGEESQVKRFEVLSTVGDLNGCSLLDLGCGYGDLKGYMDRRFN